MRTMWKMKVTEEFYQEVLRETKEELKNFNCEMLINWEIV